MTATLPPTLALYIHIPFCERRCYYCDFTVVTTKRPQMGQYVDALCREIAVWGDAVRARRAVFGDPITHSVFFGGGTPTLLPPDAIGRILEACRAAFTIAPDAEITMEANPGTTDRAGFRLLRSFGVNRLSFGVQSFDDAQLEALGRVHTAADARRAVEDARATGFANLSLDLIHSLPGQDADHWRATLDAALALAPDHVSAYGLTIEPGTVFGWRQRRGLLAAPDPDRAADLFDLTTAVLADAGFARYEIANFARPGFACRHNLTYWRNEPFLGFGAGAHSSTVAARFANHRVFSRYLAAAVSWPGPTFADSVVPEATGPIEWVEALSPQTQRAETLLLGLRLADGLDCPAFAERHGVDPRREWGDRLTELVAGGMVVMDNTRLRLTDAGRLLADEIVARLIA